MVLVCAVLLVLYTCISGVSYAFLEGVYRPYKGVAVVIDAGHGGKDLGCMYDGVNESEINLSIALLLKEDLENLGMDVIMTREDSEDLASENASNRKREDLNERVGMIAQEDIDLYISIHMNAYADDQVFGSQVFYYSENESAKQLATTIDESLKGVSNSTKEIKTGDAYFILNSTGKVGVLVECGFLTNEEERERLADMKYQSEISKALTQGIVQYLKDIHYE